MEDRNHVPLSDAAVADAIKGLQAVRAALAPFLIVLTKKERQTLPKMSDGSLAFVEKADELMQANPGLLPGYIDGAGLHLDAHTVAALLPILQLLDALVYDVSSTRMMAGSEGYVTALMAYAGFKAAAHAGQPAAQSAVNQLKPRFAGQGRGGAASKGVKKPTE